MKPRAVLALAALVMTGCPVERLQFYVIDAASDAPRDALTDASDVVTDRPDAALDATDVVTDRPDATLDATDVVTDRTDATIDATDVVTDRTDATIDATDVVTDRTDSTTDIAIDRADVVDVLTPTGQASCAPDGMGRAPAACGQVYVPGGSLALGDSSAEGATPILTSVTVSGFYIDRYEVTLARFRRFWNGRNADMIRAAPIAYVDGPMSWGPAASEPRTTSTVGCNWTSALGDREEHPINCVTWWTAQEFCVWDGGRLPTEAEWELAARGTESRPFPWGIEPPTDSRVCASLTTRRTEPDAGADVPWTCPEVDIAWSSGQTPSGIAHLAGNVEEYTADFWSSYGDPCWGTPPRSNPRCNERIDGGLLARTARGGAFDAVAPGRALRSASRGMAPEITAYTRQSGFRCVRSR